MAGPGGPPIPRPAGSVPQRLPMTIRLDGTPMTVEGPDDGDVWRALAEGQWRILVPGALRRGDRQWLWARVADPDDEFDIPDLARMGRAVMGALAGAPWWVAGRVAATTAADSLMFTAWCAQRALDPMVMPVHMLVGAGIAWIYEGAGSDGMAAMERKLWTPPEQAGPRWTPGQEAAAFREAMAAMKSRQTA